MPALPAGVALPAAFFPVEYVPAKPHEMF